MRKPYSTDLTDAQWQVLQPLLPAAKPGGRPRIVAMREVVHTLLYQNRTSCQWDRLPHDLLPKSTGYDSCCRWRDDGTWHKVLDAWREAVRQQAGRHPTPGGWAAAAGPSTPRSPKARGPTCQGGAPHTGTRAGPHRGGGCASCAGASSRGWEPCSARPPGPRAACGPPPGRPSEGWGRTALRRPPPACRTPPQVTEGGRGREVIRSAYVSMISTMIKSLPL